MEGNGIFIDQFGNRFMTLNSDSSKNTNVEAGYFCDGKIYGN